jgi:hypothetical protein
MEESTFQSSHKDVVPIAMPLICGCVHHWGWNEDLFKKLNFCLSVYLFTGTALLSAQEFFTCMKTSPLPVKGCKIKVYARRSGPLSREGSLYFHTCCDTGPQFLRSHLKDRPIQSPHKTHKKTWKTYSNSDPHGSEAVVPNVSANHDTLIMWNVGVKWSD